MKISIALVFLILMLSIKSECQSSSDNCLTSLDAMGRAIYEGLYPEKIEKEDVKKSGAIVRVDLDTSFCGISFWVLNNTGMRLYYSRRDGVPLIIREAKNKRGFWKPIEYWEEAWCDVGTIAERIEPFEKIKFETNRYEGDFKTEIRFVVLLNNVAYYSNSYQGSINEGQFEKPEGKAYYNFLW